MNGVDLLTGLSFEWKRIRSDAYFRGKDDSIAEIQVHQECRPSLGGFRNKSDVHAATQIRQRRTRPGGADAFQAEVTRVRIVRLPQPDRLGRCDSLHADGTVRFEAPTELRQRI